MKTLSNKIKPIDSDCDEHILIEDVKEFIKDILEPLTDLTKPLTKKEYYKFICERAGDKLI